MTGSDRALEEQRGVLVVGSDGKPLSAGGLAARDDIAACMLDAWRAVRSKAPRIFPANAPDGSMLVVLPVSTADATVLIATRREARDALAELVGMQEYAGDILAHFVTNPYEALAFVDQRGVLRYLSPVHERFFGLAPGSAVGRPSSEVIENSRLHEVALTGKSEIGALQEMRGVTRVVSRHAIRNARGEVVGAIGQMMFKGPEQLQAMSRELSSLRSEVAYYRRELNMLRNRSHGLDQLVGESDAMRRLKQQILKVAPLHLPVLLAGESGTGKELAAHAIHTLSGRNSADMVIVNAAALPSTLVESELFGYEAGAFTGAERKGRRGKVEQADGGTLFFDEVGDMPADVQVKLLRVLQDGSFHRVGGTETRRSDFRLISASNRNFEGMIADGSFRLDLFHRIGVVTIRLPAMRERLEDIPLLAQLALTQFAERHGQRPKRLSGEALQFLAQQRWPGNVRQLMHALECAAVFADGDVIQPGDFGMLIGAGGPSQLGEAEPSVQRPASPAAPEPVASTAPAPPLEPMRVSTAVGQVEEQMIREAMSRFNGNKKRVAEQLGISRPYLYKRLTQMGAYIPPAGPPDAPEAGEPSAIHK
jgi:transcriptional regulator with PAS, ATPase and Fis domain